MSADVRQRKEPVMPEQRDPDQPDSVNTGSPSGDPDRDVWTGRAGVRPVGAVPRDPFESEGDWGEPRPDESSGRWWTPIAVGTVSLALLALLGLGITVIVRNTGGDADPPATTSPVVHDATGPVDPVVTTPPASAETFTTVPTTEPADAEVTVPALRGMPLADAQAALSRTGLGWRVIRRESDAEPDTVIDCDPAEGQQVPSDTRVTLVVATAPTDTPTVPSTTTPSAGATG